MLKIFFRRETLQNGEYFRNEIFYYTCVFAA